jgi:hypothetical protein
MIYHYTNIHSLALILESKKIRFTRLDGVDDLREAQTVSGIQFGKYFFVSCWTKSSKEHIPLWSMYTPNMRGVRIGFPDMPFKMVPLKAPPSWNLAENGTINSPVSFAEMFNKTYCILPIFLTPDMFAGPVSYVPDMSDVYKNNVKLSIMPGSPQDILEIKNMPLIPRTKDEEWTFQNEYRFVLFITPSIPVPSDGIGNSLFVNSFPNHVLSSFLNGIDPGIDYYDLELDDVAINSIDVTVGPRAELSDHLIIEALLNRHSIKTKVKKSSLAIR